MTLPATDPKVLRDAVQCGNRWWVVGALQPAGGEPRPAAWDSADGRTWRSVTVAPHPRSFYGPRSVLYSVACSSGRIAAIGAQSGGAHGNPRTSTWYQRADGALAEVPAPFELYGGDEAVDVGRIAGGPGGFLIAGNRTSGPATWLSRDGVRFDRHEVGEKGALARDGAVFDGRYVLAGAAAPASGQMAGGAVWESADGTTWVRASVEAVEIQRLTAFHGDLIAAGQRGGTFAAWRRDAGRWAPLNDDGRSAAGGPSVAGGPSAVGGGPGGGGGPSAGGPRAGAGDAAGAGSFGRATPAGLRSLTVAAGRLVAAADRVWSCVDGNAWTELAVPAAPVAVAGGDDALLVISADRAWLTRLVP
ncbi:hypothetical protein [Actinoplanes sp. NPDC049316]|uniref:hypothetical protein n=1 Tax=Actinoplanes sp. NPDC049316 TaxID=3154727 RepID=UPI0034153868